MQTTQNSIEHDHPNVNNLLIAESESNNDIGTPNDKQEKRPVQISQQIKEINLGTEEEPQMVKIADTADAAESQKWVEFLKQYKSIFAWSYRDMQGLDPEIIMHSLPIKSDCKPVKQKLRRMRPELSSKVKEEIDKQLEAGLLEVVDYPEWLANIVVVPKKDGRIRVCVDYRDLNKASPKDDFPLPHIDILVDNAAMHFQYSFMDGYSGYNQILLDPEDKVKTAFTTPWGTFCYRVMPFGLVNAGATYQRAVVIIFHDMIHSIVEVYVDDIVAYSREGQDHMEVLKRVFDRLLETKLKLNPSKCVFGVSSGKLLGFIVSQRGIEVDPDKIKAIQEMQPPKNQTEIRGFLGRLNYIGRFISQLTATCEPLFKLLRKDQPYDWTEDCQMAFNKVKEYLQNPPVLVPPVKGRPLLLYVTVQENSMGALLAQHDETGKKERAIYYLSKKFNDCEVKYSSIEKTCCAVAWAVQRLRHYLINYTTWLLSRIDPIKYIFERPYLTSRIARWQALLSQYDIVYMTQKAVKGSAIADLLADHPRDDYEPASTEFPDEDILATYKEEGNMLDDEMWVMKFDGASNRLGKGVGAVLISPEEKQYPVAAKLRFKCTNNVAEYEACALGLKLALDMKVKNLTVYGDSDLIIRQMQDRWNTRDPKLVPYNEYLKALVEQFEEVQFDYIPREKNQLADALATLAAMLDLEGEGETELIQIHRQEIPAYCLAMEQVPDGKPWFFNISQYLKNQEYPIEASETDKKTIRRLAAGYFLSGETLYKRSFDGTLLRCLNAEEAQRVIKEVHEGSCGSHSNGQNMARKIMRAGYYWSTIESDCISYVRKCHKCQIYADNTHGRFGSS